jgi:hypothetical protein
VECDKSRIDEGRETIVEYMNEPNEYLKLKYPVGCALYGPLEAWSKS